jgi:Glyoxalase-like domain
VTAIPVRWLTVFLDFPAGSFGAGVAFWREVTGSTLSPFRGAAEEFATLLPPSGDAYLRVQRTADGSGGHHLDLHVDPAVASVEQAAERAVALGARVRHRSGGLVISASPGGFTFCLVRWHGEGTVPGPVRLDGAGASRADELCLDIPARTFERERSFWTALTGWEGHDGARSAQPVRLELRRAGPDDRVTGHLAFACADREQLAARHAAAGARILAVLPHETEMADPADRFYRLTDDSAAGR